MHKEKRRKQALRTFGRVCGWLALALLLFTLLTGYGIAEFRIVTPLTLNLLNKAAAQRLHAYTELPMALLLLVHVGIALWARRREGNKKGRMTT
jgi:hypothetical protein